MAKIGVILGSVGIAAIGVAGISLAFAGKLPGWVAVSTEENANTEYGSGYAKDYLRLLVSSVKEENDPWWKWSFNHRYQNDKLKQDKGGFKDATEQTLKEKCKNAYKAVNGKVKSGDNSPAADDEFKERDIWWYCSEGGAKVKTIEEAGDDSYSDEESYGKKYKNKLVSVRDEGNRWFWNIKEVDLFDADETAENKNGNSAFKKTESMQRIKDGLSDGAMYKFLRLGVVKMICEKAYSQKETDSEYPKSDVFKFCSVSGKVEE